MGRWPAIPFVQSGVQRELGTGQRLVGGRQSRFGDSYLVTPLWRLVTHVVALLAYIPNAAFLERVALIDNPHSPLNHPLMYWACR